MLRSFTDSGGEICWQGAPSAHASSMKQRLMQPTSLHASPREQSFAYVHASPGWLEVERAATQVVWDGSNSPASSAKTQVSDAPHERYSWLLGSSALTGLHCVGWGA